MNTDESIRFTKALVEIDAKVTIDSSGPPEYSPFCVIFSREASLNDQNLEELSDYFQQLEYVNFAQTKVSLAGLAHLSKSVSLKVVTIPYGLPADAVSILFAIPTLRRIRIPIPDAVIGDFHHHTEEYCVTDHMTISRKSDCMPQLKELYPNAWKQIYG